MPLLIHTWLPALLIAAVTIISVAGYSCLALRLCRRLELPIVITLGLAILLTLSLITGIAGGYNWPVQTLVIGVGFLLLGLMGEERSLLAKSFGAEAASLSKRPALPFRSAWPWLAFPFAYFLSRFFTAGLPQQHGDALYYHLAAPKLWAELGQIRLTPEHPSFAQSTLWEVLYGLPQLWLGTEGLFSHVSTQVFGQWMHLLFGVGMTTWLCAALLRRLVPDLEARPGFTFFLAWLCAALPSVEWTGALAKNDYLISTFALAALLVALKSRWFLAGILAGLALSTKILALWLCLGLLAFIPWRQWPRFAAGAALAFLPLAVRNLLWTGNPVFPMLDSSMGPGWLSSWWVGHLMSYGGAPRLDLTMIHWIWDKAFEKGLPKILLAAGAVALLAEWVRARMSPHAKAKRAGGALPLRLGRRWLLFFGIPLAGMMLTLRYPADGRYANYVAIPALVFFSAALVRALWRELGSYPAVMAVLFLPLGFLVNSPIDQIVKVPREYLFAPAARYPERFHAFFEAKRWVGEKLPASPTLVAATYDKAFFYMDRRFETFAEMRKWEELLAESRNFEDFLSRIRKAGYRYFLFEPESHYPEGLRRYWQDLTRRTRFAVFRSKDFAVLDLGADSP